MAINWKKKLERIKRLKKDEKVSGRKYKYFSERENFIKEKLKK